jgi:two-component system chemotaxis response regulator CheB
VRTRDLVVIGASAGGIEALRNLVGKLPADLPAAVLVVVHMPARGASVLAQILSRAGSLPAEQAAEGQQPRHGRIYVGRPDHHLMIRKGRLRVVRGPRENGHRPAIDPLFRSAAQERGPGCVGVVLSGSLDDGAAGVAIIHRAGGAVLVQDPTDAAFASMPSAALAEVPDAVAAPAEQLAAHLDELVREEVTGDMDPDGTGWQELNDREVAIAGFDTDELGRSERPGEPSGLICPDCGGSLDQLADTGAQRYRYRCRVGHAWSPDSLAVQQDLAVENALWHAARVLAEKASLHRRMAASAQQRGTSRLATNSERTAQEAEQSATLIEKLLRSFERNT